jgi:glycerol uptake facilitator-like aquaporin
MMKAYGAEFIGTFWLVLGGVAAQSWRPLFLSWVLASMVLRWPSA